MRNSQQAILMYHTDRHANDVVVAFLCYFKLIRIAVTKKNFCLMYVLSST